MRVKLKSKQTNTDKQLDLENNWIAVLNKQLELADKIEKKRKTNIPIGKLINIKTALPINKIEKIIVYRKMDDAGTYSQSVEFSNVCLQHILMNNSYFKRKTNVTHWMRIKQIPEE